MSIFDEVCSMIMSKKQKFTIFDLTLTLTLTLRPIADTVIEADVSTSADHTQKKNFTVILL